MFYRSVTIAALALILFARWCPEALALESDKESSKIHFFRGIEFFKKGRYEDALIDFKASYSFHSHWKIRYNIAMCLYKLKRHVEAAEEFSAFLEEGGDEMPQVQSGDARDLLHELKKKLGTVRFIGNVKNAIVIIDDRQEEGIAAGDDIFLEPGLHKVMLAIEKIVVFEDEVFFQPGATKKIHLEIPEEGKPGTMGYEVRETAAPRGAAAGKPASGDRMKKAAWASLGVAAVLLAAGIVTGGLVFNEKGAYEDAQDEYLSGFNSGLGNEELALIDERRREHYDRASDLALSTDTLLGLGAVFAVATVVLFAVGVREKRKQKHANLSKLTIGPGAAYLNLNF